VLRPGSITLSQLQAVVGPVSSGADASSPRVPGSTLAHYSPRTPLQQVDGGQLAQLLAQGLAAGQRLGVLAQGPPPRVHPALVWIDAGAHAVSYAHDLYANLRQLDQSGCARLLVSRVPDDETWDAVRDRLRRAAAPSDLTD
jgi:L-threonylcarbamoyladenylate synthase